MKRVLFITNKEVPYRVKFFNGLAERCDLTVLIECENPVGRDKAWMASQQSRYKKVFLGGIHHEVEKLESSFSWRILPLLHKGWDCIIVGCINSRVQIMAMLYMRLIRRPYILSLDGEIFLDSGHSFAKKLMIRGAKTVLTAGEKSTERLRAALGPKLHAVPYYFGSMSRHELEALTQIEAAPRREDFVLLVSGYVGVKGPDIALQVAQSMPDVPFKFVGMGGRMAQFCADHAPLPPNVEMIPFLQTPELQQLYRTCACMILPSRQECWGLVVNEAAAFGTPIVSTYGSGSAVELLADAYPQYLAPAGDADALRQRLTQCLAADNTAYSEYLKAKALEYNVERSVQCVAQLITNN